MLSHNYDSRSRPLVLPERTPLTSAAYARRYVSDTASRHVSPFPETRHMREPNPRPELDPPSNTRNADQPMREARGAKTETQPTRRGLDDIEKEVSDALRAFQEERNNQISVIGSMRRELSGKKATLRRRASAAEPSRECEHTCKGGLYTARASAAPRLEDSVTPAATTRGKGARERSYSGCNSRAARVRDEREDQLKKLQAELSYTKDLLNGKEEELTEQILINKQLSGEVTMLKATETQRLQQLERERGCKL